jgi:hypothetical protein
MALYRRHSIDSRLTNAGASRTPAGHLFGAHRRVMLPAGVFKLEGTLALAAGRGVMLEGSGTDATVLLVDRPAAVGVAILDCEGSGLANLTVKAAAECASLVGIGRTATREEQAEQSLPSATHCTLDNVVLDCGAYEKDGVQTSWAKSALSLAGTVNENNDCHTFRRVRAHSYQVAGLYISGNMSKGHLLDGCTFDGNGIGRAAVWSAGGGWRAIGCNSAGHSMADVFIEEPGDSITLVGWHGETSRRFVDQPNKTGAMMSVTLEGCEWMADQLAPDGNAVRVNGPGPLTVIGGHYGSGNQPLVYFSMDPLNDEPCAFRCDGVTFGTFGQAQAPESPFRLPALCSRGAHSNLYADGRPGREGMAVLRPEWQF